MHITSVSPPVDLTSRTLLLQKILMESFYDGSHVRTNDRMLVERAWHSYWDGRVGDTFLAWVSPEYNGWVSLFDWRCDQQQDVETLTNLSAHISRFIGTVTVAFQLQDSDLIEYWLFNRGIRIDHYTSNREYFAGYVQSADVASETGCIPDSVRM